MLTRSFPCCVALLLITAGCGKEEQHGPEFVGTWKSGLPYSPLVDPTTAVGKRIGTGIESRMRAANASGEQGVELKIRADGSFTMRVWWSNQALRAMAVKGQEVPDMNLSTPGRWSSDRNWIHLHPEKFLPYAYTRVDVTTMPRGRPLERHSQQLSLFLSAGKNGLSPFKGMVSEAAKRSQLNFVRKHEKP